MPLKLLACIFIAVSAVYHVFHDSTFPYFTSGASREQPAIISLASVAVSYVSGLGVVPYILENSPAILILISACRERSLSRVARWIGHVSQASPQYEIIVSIILIFSGNLNLN
jgi:hypothetical protein